MILNQVTSTKQGEEIALEIIDMTLANITLENQVVPGTSVRQIRLKLFHFFRRLFFHCGLNIFGRVWFWSRR